MKSSPRAARISRANAAPSRRSPASSSAVEWRFVVPRRTFPDLGSFELIAHTYGSRLTKTPSRRGGRLALPARPHILTHVDMSVSMRISSTAGCVFALVRSASASASALARRAFAPVARGRARRIVSSVSSMRSSVRSGARARSPGARARTRSGRASMTMRTNRTRRIALDAPRRSRRGRPIPSTLRSPTD